MPLVRPSLEERLERDICGAKKHYREEICTNKPVMPGRRCRFHGGMTPRRADKRRERILETGGKKLKAWDGYLPARREEERLDRSSET